MVNVVPSALTAVTLLKVSSLSPATWYLIIVPIGISVNTFPGLFSVLPPLIVPPSTLFGKSNVSKKLFALKSRTWSDEAEASCFTDLISLEP